MRLEFFASVKNPHHSVIVRAKHRGRIFLAQWSIPLALEVADTMRALRDSPEARAQGFVALDVFPRERVLLEVELAQVDGVADELVRTASRASGARA